MRALLVSTYDLGRQPFGLASPAAWLRRAGIETDCVDTSREPLTDEQLSSAALIAFYLPMHTATRLAGGLIGRARRVNPSAALAAYGLYAPLNDVWLRERGVGHVLGPEAESDLVSLAEGLAGVDLKAADPTRRQPVPAVEESAMIPRLALIQADRRGLPPLSRYARLTMPDGSSRTVGSTDASRGCKHLCRHCPIVPVYKGQFRVVPVEAVLADIRAQVAAGAEHISFGDPDFLNGPTHARRIVERLAGEFPGLSYDVTIKIEHLLQHRDMLETLRRTGCLFVTSAVEAVDDRILQHLRKGHTRADFELAVHACRDSGLTLAPTFVPFTPWTTPEGYVELLATLERLQLVDAVPSIQLVIRLLITSESPLLDLPDIRAVIRPFERGSLSFPWRHPDPRVDALQDEAMRLVGGTPQDRGSLFNSIAALADAAAGRPVRPARTHQTSATPFLNEPWYCCAEPAADDIRFV